MQKTLSKKFYLSSYIIGGALNILLSLAMLIQHDNEAVAFALLLNLFTGIYLTVVGCVMWYKAWAAIQDGNARTTPGRAVGFLFIPIYNFYWIFQVVFGYAKDYNSYIESRKIRVNKLPDLFFLVATVMLLFGIVLSWVPVVSTIYIIGAFVILLFLVSRLIDAVNNLAYPKDKIERRTEDASEKYAKRFSDKAAGIITILLTCNALFQTLIYYTGYFNLKSGRLTLSIMPIYHWGLIIYLGSLCRHRILRIIAMCLPLIPLVMHVIQFLTYFPEI